MNTPLIHPEVGAVKAIHPEVLAAHGGATGIRDTVLLASAVAALQGSTMGQPMFSYPINRRALSLQYLPQPPLPLRQQTHGLGYLLGLSLRE